MNPCVLNGVNPRTFLYSFLIENKKRTPEKFKSLQKLNPKSLVLRVGDCDTDGPFSRLVTLCYKSLYFNKDYFNLSD